MRGSLTPVPPARDRLVRSDPLARADRLAPLIGRPRRPLDPPELPDQRVRRRLAQPHLRAIARRDSPRGGPEVHDPVVRVPPRELAGRPARRIGPPARTLHEHLRGLADAAPVVRERELALEGLELLE